jgi:glycosyltransferase involved in cell wall biosynthesis
MSILLVEPKAEGHHFALYLRFILRRLLEQNRDVTLLTTRRAMSHPSARLLESDLNKISIHYLPDDLAQNVTSNFALLKRQILAWFKLRALFRSLNRCRRFSIVYMPTCDWIVKAMELLGSPFGSCPLNLLYMFPSHHRCAMNIGPKSKSDWLYGRLFERLLRISTLRHILVIDPYFKRFCDERYGFAASKVMYVPDFAEIKGTATRAVARQAFALDDSTVVILVYGALSLRKGVQQLLTALVSYNPMHPLTVLMAGKPDQDIEEFLGSKICEQLVAQGRLVLRPYFQNDHEEYACFRAADWVWLGYVDGFCGSSGVLHQATSLNIPLISMRNGLIGRTVEEDSLGFVIDPESEVNIHSVFDSILHDQDASSEFATGLSRFAKVHRAKNHIDIVLRALTTEVRKNTR